MPKLRTLEGTMPTGLKGICGNPNKCAIANQLRTEHGVQRPKVGLNTIEFNIGDTKYIVQTPRPLQDFIRAFDKHHEDGEVETLLCDVDYRIPLNGKSVTTKPVERLTEERKAALRATPKTAARREQIRTADARYKAINNARTR